MKNYKELLDKLLIVVNGVTAFHRHGNPIPPHKLDRLANVQIDIEDAIEGIQDAEDYLKKGNI